MSTPDLTVSRAHELLNRITQDDDGAHVNELLELVWGVADPKSIVAMEVTRHLYSLTPDFQKHMKVYLENLKVA